MSSKKEEKSQAADKIKAAALSAAKGLSRAQAERAATAAARNVNAYGQKEEGPSRWQERKEAKRQMYLMSTEKAVKLGERKKTSMSVPGASASQCQKCFQAGHWTYECKNERVYISRPSRSQQLKNPAKTKLVVSFEGNPDVRDRDDEEELDRGVNGEEGEKMKSSKRKHRSGKKSGSDTSSEASVFESESESSESESESDYSSSESESSESESEERRRRRRKRQKKRKQHDRYSSSSESSSESDDASSDSNSSGDRHGRRRSNRKSESRNKSKKHSNKRR
ncbi:Zinc finger CCHC domain-containing protein 10 [Zostera marina]|uniref:Zinc finger CCHC domain-containing protein 10 n=1 Tax=Zostera marina TaxID=29655 RepID=A0A0K9PF62_ZOSMR|nr:Zinc finger CCHC domain-containing protein 10 [Zostera marina]